MKIFGWQIQRLKAKEKARVTELWQADSPASTFWGAASLWTPSTYGNYMATSVPAYRAIKLRADAIASAPLIVYRRQKGGAPEAVESEHPIQQLVDRVNGWWTQSDLLRATETMLCLWGSAYWFVERQGQIPVGLWPLRPDRIRVLPASGDKPSDYIAGFKYVSVQGTTIPLTKDEIVWFRYFNPLDEYAGLSPLAAARLSLDMGQNALQFNASFFKNGAIPQDIIYPVQGPVTDEEIEDFYRRLAKRHQGPSRAHRPMVVDLSMMGKPERIGFTQKDMEFLSSLNFTVEEAARVWGIPPPKMYSQTQSTYNNVKQADIEFYTDTIANEWHFLETEITEMLMPALGESDLYVAFDTANILPLQEALSDLHDSERLDVQAGILTINEVRERRHMEPVLWGDEPMTGIFPISEMPNSSPAIPLKSNGHSPLLIQKGLTVESNLNLFAKRLDNQQRQFLHLQRLLFQAQEAEILAKLKTNKALTKQAGDIFDVAEWTVRAEARGLPLVMRIFVSAAADHASDWGLGPFNSERESVRRWIEDRVRFWADRTNIETARLLMAELEEGAKLGEGIPELSSRVEKVFAFNDKIRSVRIARTETLAASNAGHLEVYRQSGIVGSKIWLTALDERVREAHAEAHGQVVALDASFTVGGEQLEAPGIGGSPENTINCRCTVNPVIGLKTLLPPVVTPHEDRKKLKRTIERDENGFITAIVEETNGHD